MSQPIPNTNEIKMYFHCGKCVAEYKANPSPTGSPSDYQQISAGFTPLGLQIWCKRHECNICHIDFEGMKHKANTLAASAPVPEDAVKH